MSEKEISASVGRLMHERSGLVRELALIGFMKRDLVMVIKGHLDDDLSVAIPNSLLSDLVAYRMDERRLNDRLREIEDVLKLF